MCHFTDKKYSIGELENPTEDDEGFNSKSRAIKEAVKRCPKSSGPCWGVWENDSGELLVIIYLGTIYV